MCESKPRYCYRCNTCLAVFVTEERFGYNDCYKAECQICNSTGIESMGKIGLDQKLTQDKIACKCDDRCAWASGPVCNCMCGGANHQSGPYGYTKVTIELGIPKLTCTDAKTITKHKAMAEQFTAALAAAKSRIQPQPHGVPWTVYKNWKNNCQLIRKASFSKSHNDRLKKLAKAFQVVEVTNTQTEQKTC